MNVTLKISIALASVVLVLVGARIFFALQPHLSKDVPKDFFSCIVHGGSWHQSTPPFASSFCYMKMSDYGKACQSSQECRGHCLPVYTNDLQKTGEYRTDTGRCSYSLPEPETPDRFEGRPIENGDY